MQDKTYFFCQINQKRINEYFTKLAQLDIAESIRIVCIKVI